MATYKVLQDIEAEDKLLGPLSLRQFLYAVVVVVLGFLCFTFITKNVWFLAIPLLPPMAFFGVLAAPFGHDQPSEVWLLGKVRFWFVPRKRIWDQSGLKELVNITVPKKEEVVRTDGLSQDQVRSRLKALSTTLDSRGWAIKNVSINMAAQPSYVGGPGAGDRLLNPLANAPIEVPDFGVRSTDDILDTGQNPVAQHMQDMLSTSEQTHRQQLLDHMHQMAAAQTQAQTAAQPAISVAAPQPTPTADIQQPYQNPYEIPGYTPSMPQAARPTTDVPKVPPVAEVTTTQSVPIEEPPTPQIPVPSQEVTIMQNVEADIQNNAKPPQANTMTPEVETAILELANNDDLDLATISRQVHKAQDKSLPEDEVVINLH